MKPELIIKHARRFATPFRVTDGEKFRLKDHDPADTLDFTEKDKPRAKEALATGVEALAELQDKLYAQDQWAVLLIFQAMDAAGKDGRSSTSCPASTRRMRSPFLQGSTSEELTTIFCGAAASASPARGRIGIFN